MPPLLWLARTESFEGFAAEIAQLPRVTLLVVAGKWGYVFQPFEPWWDVQLIPASEMEL